jgi:anoctamin-10
MSIIYDFVARKLCEWENYEKKSQRDDSLAIKLVFFEFINHYIALYYIAFLKPYLNEPCIENNCLKEIEIQLYIILLLHFTFNLLGLLVPFVKTQWRLRKMKENIKNYNATIKNKRRETLELEFKQDNNLITNENEELNENLDIKTHSLEHQIICEPCDSLMEEYDELVKLFGYVCFFSVSAPLTPAIIFILTYLEKFCDSYKLFYLSRITIIEGCTGIEIYNNIFKVFYFIGMLTNISLVLFTNPHLINTEEYKSLDFRNNTDFIVKFIIFAILENFILFIMGFLDYNILPKCITIFI